MDELLVQVDGIGFSYKRPVLTDFSLHVAAGTTALLIGLNGAGKSTALGLMAGEQRPECGRVRIVGCDPRRASGRRNLYFLKEASLIHSHLTATETLRFYRGLYGHAKLSPQELATLLERVGLAEVAKRRASTFSKGMRRRLELACILAVDPRVWLLDEPQTGLDPLGLRLLRELCQEAKARGRALIIASHALSDIPALADRVLVLDRGREVFSGDRQELLGRVGAEQWQVAGARPGFREAIRALAREHGGVIEGPDVPAGPLEDLLFKGRP